MSLLTMFDLTKSRLTIKENEEEFDWENDFLLKTENPIEVKNKEEEEVEKCEDILKEFEIDPPHNESQEQVEQVEQVEVDQIQVVSQVELEQQLVETHTQQFEFEQLEETQSQQFEQLDTHSQKVVEQQQQQDVEDELKSFENVEQNEPYLLETFEPNEQDQPFPEVDFISKNDKNSLFKNIEENISKTLFSLQNNSKQVKCIPKINIEEEEKTQIKQLNIFNENNKHDDDYWDSSGRIFKAMTKYVVNEDEFDQIERIIYYAIQSILEVCFSLLMKNKDPSKVKNLRISCSKIIFHIGRNKFKSLFKNMISNKLGGSTLLIAQLFQTTIELFKDIYNPPKTLPPPPPIPSPIKIPLPLPPPPSPPKRKRFSSPIIKRKYLFNDEEEEQQPQQPKDQHNDEQDFKKVKQTHDLYELF